MTSGQAVIGGTSDAETSSAQPDMIPQSSPKTHEEIESSSLTNLTKEKTPMCLVNELARYNKITHQYRLTNEEGPAHMKVFTVTLKLGDEEYSAEGASIKKAQHLAANNALKSTLYKHPPPKTSRNDRVGRNNLTPTVELNALAMKLGEPTVYTFVEVPMHGYSTPNNIPYQRGGYTQVRPPYTPNTAFNTSNRNMGRKQFNPNFRFDSQRLYGLKASTVYKVTVKIGERTYNGEGATAQAARHDAAAKALDELRELPLKAPVVVAANPSNVECAASSQETYEATELKSPISLVHELSLKQNLSVVFDVISENGPPHMRKFVTRCRVGENFETLGEGNRKKLSKKRAAENMLEQLKLLPPITTVTPANYSMPLRSKNKQHSTKKKSRNLIKVTNSSPNKENHAETPEGIVDINPISRLMQLQQAKKEKDPIYTLVEDKGPPGRRKEFLMKVTIGEHSFLSSGPNKKIAKRNAAEGLLQKLGYYTYPTKTSNSNEDINRKGCNEADNPVKSSVGGSGGRQLVPGLLLMSDNKGYSSQHNSRSSSKGHVNVQATASRATEYLNGTSHLSDDKSNGGSIVRPKDQLLYLAQLLGFKVEFSDFPKVNHREILSLVSLSTDPPQVLHGYGGTIEFSQDQAALNALESLSQMGLAPSTPMKNEPTFITQNLEGMYSGKGTSSMNTNYINSGTTK